MDSEIIDLNEFLERVQDDKELLLELLDIFVSDFQEKSKLLHDAIANKDYDQIKSIAHSMKGASGNISAKPLRETFLKIEEIGKNSDVSGAEDLLKTMDEQFKSLTVRVAGIKEEFK